MSKLFVDQDGVMANFNLHYTQTFGVPVPKRSVEDKDGHDIDWSAIYRHKNFYRGIPPMPDFYELWDFVKLHHPTIITGIPSSIPEATDNKVDWVREYCQPMPPVICCASKNKWHYCAPGDIIIDDWEKYKNLWEKAGGIWITHRSAHQTIASLFSIGFGK